MNSKKPIVRMDLATRKTYPREELFRLVVQGGKILLDKDGNLPGRGIYVLKDGNSIAKIFRKGMLKRYCRDDEILSHLEKELQDAAGKTN